MGRISRLNSILEGRSAAPGVDRPINVTKKLISSHDFIRLLTRILSYCRTALCVVMRNELTGATFQPGSHVAEPVLIRQRIRPEFFHDALFFAVGQSTVEAKFVGQR